MAKMFRHSCGWDLNARILRLVTDFEFHPCNIPNGPMDRLRQIVRDEIAQDQDLVWC